MTRYSLLLAILCALPFQVAWAVVGETTEEIIIDEEIEEEEEEEIRIKPVVQFSCAVVWTPQENAWEKQLHSEKASEQIDALSKLFHYHAGRSVPDQYKTYLMLKDTHAAHPTIQQAKQRFNLTQIQDKLKQNQPIDRYDDGANEFFWYIRAAGALQADTCIPRLLELCASQNLYTQLAVERSLIEMDPVKAESALIRVVSLFKYNASDHAARHLFERKSEAFYKALPQMRAPERYKGTHALWLARINDPSCVPALCETVANRSMGDWNYFNAIAALGRVEDRAIILALPKQVRENQQESAQKCVDAYLVRMAALDQ